jgi:hypothetical protein
MSRQAREGRSSGQRTLQAAPLSVKPVGAGLAPDQSALNPKLVEPPAGIDALYDRFVAV